MGYYTHFELSVYEGEADIELVKQRLDEVMEMVGDSCFSVADELISSIDSLPWYDHDTECAEVSKSFPGTVLRLHGEGSDTADLWDAYYKDGLCQICRAHVMYPEYDGSKLQSVVEAQLDDGGR